MHYLKKRSALWEVTAPGDVDRDSPTVILSLRLPSTRSAASATASALRCYIGNVDRLTRGFSGLQTSNMASDLVA